MRKMILILLLAALLLAGCSEIAAVPPADGTNEIEETKAPAVEAAAEAESAFSSAMKIDLSQTVLAQDGIKAQILLDNRGALQKAGAAIESAAQEACKAAASSMHEDVRLKSSIAVPDWQTLGALMITFAGDAAGVLERSAIIEAGAEEGAIVLGVSWPQIVDMDAERDALIEAQFIVAYIKTVYDDNGFVKEYAAYPMSGEYIAALGDPLPGRHIKDGWYLPRDKGTRLHTGTDIKAPVGTHILSCTDGEVLAIGSGEKAGNYVIVRDSEGFQYHYYHMRQLTDFLAVGDAVKKGQLVGYVGSTGNSSANHLHLAIIAPDMTYVNPYDVLRQLRGINGTAEQ